MAQVTSYKLSSDAAPRYEACIDKAHAILKKAADEWALGHPEKPPTKEVLTAMLKVFEDERFLVRPFGA